MIVTGLEGREGGCMSTRTQQLKDCGQSLWLDNIQRSDLRDGTLARMIAQDGICGVTSNPTIFMKAVSGSSDYDAQIRDLASQGLDARGICERIIRDDIREAAELFLSVHTQTGARDGYVSLELNPTFAADVAASLAEARDIRAALGTPNLMIKVPGTVPGLEVIRTLTTEAINVNATLLFSPQRYRQVALAYVDGLEAAAAQGRDISGVASVASFFISRIDTKVDARLDAIGRDRPDLAGQCAAARGTAAILVAKCTYGIFQEVFASERFRALQDRGARVQRVLWASTGTKDPAYSDVKYVDGLIGPQTVNTLPPKTISAFRDHGTCICTIGDGLQDAPAALEAVRACGIDFEAVYAELEREGVAAFEDSYRELLQSIQEKSRQLR